MKYYIGTDGGGTKTRTVISDENLRIIHSTEGGPSNLLIVPKERIAHSLLAQLNECISAVNAGYEDIDAMVLGTAGAGRETEAAVFREYFISFLEEKKIPPFNFSVVSDAMIALEAAFSGKPGSILISGTGSIMYGKDGQGQIHRVGGFGRVLGDEGSAYRIGLKGLNVLSKFFDGRIRHTLLNKLIPERFGLNNQEMIINKVYKENFDIASVAQMVIYAAKKDDAEALKIINEESDELVLIASAMKNKIKTEPFKVVLSGSVIAGNNFFAKTLRKKLKLKIPGIVIQEPEYTPETGAVMIGKKISGTSQ